MMFVCVCCGGRAQAFRLEQSAVVHTPTGRINAKAGDWLVVPMQAKPFVREAENFNRMFRLEEATAEEGTP
jgi:hypothetical protein